MAAEANKTGPKAFRKMERREFLKLARNAGIFALTVGRGNTGPLLTKYTGIDLDWSEHYLIELKQYLNQGKILFVLEEAGRHYNMLQQARFPLRMARAAEIQMSFGMLQASAQDSALPWFERALPTISTYNRIEQEVLARLPPQKYSSYQAHLFVRRAPLYREIGNLEKSLNQFTSALNDCVYRTEDIGLLVELFYSRAHVWAVLGDEPRWRLDLDQAKKHVQQCALTRSKELSSLITYTEGEGYKRLAYNKRLDFSEERRVWYAAQGLACFECSHLEESRWPGHIILNGVAAAQCMILIDPNEAIRQAEYLRVEAQHFYPSIIQKIDHTIDIAQKRLQKAF